MAITLRPYQSAGKYFMVTRPGSILGDDVGLGKTYQALSAVATIDKVATSHEHLIISPHNLKGQWYDAIVAYFHDIPTIKTIDNAGEESCLLFGSDTTIYLAHFEQFQNRSKQDKRAKPVTQAYLNIRWASVTVDEAHRMKNVNSQRHHWITQLHTQYKFALTGTPMSDKPSDIFGLLNWIDRKEFPHFWPFVEYYCYTAPGFGGHKQEVVGAKKAKMPHLRKRLERYLLARTLADVGVELPGVTFRDITLEMGPEQAELYRQVREENIIDLKQRLPEKAMGLGWDFDAMDDQLIITSAGARFTFSQRVTSDPHHYNVDVPSIKMDAFKDYCEDVGQPCVIFTRFRSTVARIEQFIKANKKEYPWLKDCVVGTYDKISEGLNLQHLHHIIMWDLPLRRTQYHQAPGRCNRLGQKNHVIIHRFIVRKSVDLHVRRLIEGKHNLVTEYMEWLRGLFDRQEDGE